MPTTLHEIEAERGVQEAAGDYWARTRLRIFSSWVTDGDYDRKLDLGCGSGYLARHLLDQGHSVVGLDINRASLAVGSAAAEGIFVQGNALRTPFADGSFDCVVLADVYEHLEAPRDLLAECHRLLAPDGDLLVSVPAFRWLYGPHDEHNDHVDRFTTGRLTEQVTPAGFTLEAGRYTNVVPLLPYFLFQRVLRRDVPEGSRGSHNRVLEWLKGLLVTLEVAIPWPAGITLMARYRRVDEEV